MNEQKASVLGRRLRDLRVKFGWSQADLAAKIGTSGAIVGRYERGYVKPSINVLQKLADIFQVSLDYFVSEGAPLVAYKDQGMMERLRRLSDLAESDQELILSVIDGLIRDAISRATYKAHRQ